MANNIQIKDANGTTVTLVTQEVSTGVHVPVRRDDGFTPVSTHTSNSTLTTAVTLTPATGATKLLIQAFGANVRYTLDGTTPTATVGFDLIANDPPMMILLNASLTLKVIQEAAGASIQYQWGS